MRMIGRFIKKGNLRFISHLDILRTMARAMSRAKVPVRFSQGFHPHAQFSFAQAAQMGMESEYEIIDIKLEKDMAPEDFVSRMSANLPDDLKYIDAAAAPDKAPTAMGICSAGSYRIAPADTAILSAVPMLLAAEEAIVIKRTKKGDKEVNIRPDILTIEVQDAALLATVRLDEGHAVRPDMLLHALANIAGASPEIAMLTRNMLYAENLPMLDYYRGLANE